MRLHLAGFRNFNDLKIEIGNHPVVITGANGTGKTNLLEAVSLLVPGRGLRGAPLNEIDRHGGPGGWTVSALLETAAGPVRIGTGRRPPEERRIVRINGTPTRGQAELDHHACAVWLTPQMSGLFSGGPSGRRRFIDRIASGFDPAHTGRIARYENALRERSRLLRDGRGDIAWLDTLETTMAECGVAVIAARQETANRINRASAAGHGVFPRAVLDLTGRAEEWLASQPAAETESRICQTLAESRTTDATGGGAGIGPHRTDLVIHHADKGMPGHLCSTGEQKALLLAVTLAHAQLHAAERDEAPLLLLDEVAAHLDETRREALFGDILDLGGQFWITGTDPAVFRPLGNNVRHLATGSDMAPTQDL